MPGKHLGEEENGAGKHLGEEENGAGKHGRSDRMRCSK
jgi:hypothetical protein